MTPIKDRVQHMLPKPANPTPPSGPTPLPRLGPPKKLTSRLGSWKSDVPYHDDFGLPIKNVFVDGRTHTGAWAIMTPASYYKHGIGLGVGRGQCYRRRRKDIFGPWIRVG